ncbi:MAG TPA: hypothetical protein VM534_01360, partial [Thermoanaerobaculia bacterium]|nr:hypothetical protein [Thermoanaerobaculia bacterium]
MKRMFTLVLLVALCALPAMAGVSYEFASKTDGAQGSTMAGKASIEGKNLRLDIDEGDGVLFQDGMTVLSQDGGKTLTLLDPKEKTYYEMDLEQILSGMGAMLQAMGPMMKLSFENQKINVAEKGSGGAVEGFATTKYVVDSQY